MHDVAEMPGRLKGFLGEMAPNRECRVTTYEVLTGGYSRSMARAEVTWEDGSTETLVLRGDPPEGQGVFVTDRDQEWAVLQALTRSGRTPMPAARWYDATGAHLGTKTIVLDWCSGPSLRSLLEQGVDLDRHTVDLVDTMAAIHTLDLSTVVSALPTPEGWETYMDGLLGEWRFAEKAHPEAMPVVRYVGAWLDSHRPVPMAFTLLHGDFQASNILVEGGSQHLIDWEFAHIGDPREDLGYYNVYSSAAPPNLYERDPEAFLARYRERTGASEDAVNPLTVAYFSAVAAVKVFSGVLAAVGAMATGRGRGIMTTYNLNALTIGHRNFLAICRMLDQGLEVGP